MRRLKAERKYQMAIDVGINPHIGGMLVNLLTRDDVRGALKKISAKKPSDKNPGSRPKGRRGGRANVRHCAVPLLRAVARWDLEST
jgi:hypothetical protein